MSCLRFRKNELYFCDVDKRVLKSLRKERKLVHHNSDLRSSQRSKPQQLQLTVLVIRLKPALAFPPMFWVEAVQLFCPCRHFGQPFAAVNCSSFQTRLSNLKSFSKSCELFLSQLSCWKSTRCHTPQFSRISSNN